METPNAHRFSSADTKFTCKKLCYVTLWGDPPRKCDVIYEWSLHHAPPVKLCVDIAYNTGDPPKVPQPTSFYFPNL